MPEKSNKELKGSQKHILELISRNDFVEYFNNLMFDTKITIKDTKTLKPESLTNKEEYSLFSYCKEKSSEFDFLKRGTELASWWAPEGGKLPTWDLLSICEINGEKALLLVEAKAHIKEFDWNGKKLSESASDNSKKNHTNIANCIKEANSFLPDFNLSIETHYQLVNRIVSAWKLSSLGIPVVLLYLGFKEDEVFKDPFKNNEVWKEEFDKYIKGIVPDNFVNNLKAKPFLFFEKFMYSK